MARATKVGWDWLTLYLPVGLKRAVQRLADRERRKASVMGRILLEEALQARGEKWEEEEHKSE